MSGNSICNSATDELSEMEGGTTGGDVLNSSQASYKSGGVRSDILNISSFGTLQKGNYTDL
jgi:hypothetical protein